METTTSGITCLGRMVSNPSCARAVFFFTINDVVPGDDATITCPGGGSLADLAANFLPVTTAKLKKASSCIDGNAAAYLLPARHAPALVPSIQATVRLCDPAPLA